MFEITQAKALRYFVLTQILHHMSAAIFIIQNYFISLPCAAQYLYKSKILKN